MATTLSHGYIKPANPDTGDTFWGNLAADIQLANDHVHDGTTGTVLPTVVDKTSIATINWVAVAGQTGTYSQTVTMPTTLSYDSAEVSFRLTNGTKIYPTVTRVSASQYVVYTNDNTQAYWAVYSS